MSKKIKKYLPTMLILAAFWLLLWHAWPGLFPEREQRCYIIEYKKERIINGNSHYFFQFKGGVSDYVELEEFMQYNAGDKYCAMYDKR